ncbi:MAG: HAD family phosphatase [Sphingobium sp.]
MGRITAVIFDVGDVLFPWTPRRLYERLIEDDRALDAFMRDVVSMDWHFQHDLGRPFAETSAELIALHPQHAALIRLWGESFVDSIGAPIEGMAAVVADLHANAVALYGLTNFSAEFWRPFHAREADFFTPFAGILVSGEEGLAKPDPAIYRLALHRFGLRAEESLFIDDRQVNVDAAQREGIRALQFCTAAALRTELRELGLLAR